MFRTFLFLFILFIFFNLFFASNYFKLIYDLTKYCRGLRTWIRGTQLSSPPPRPRPPARTGAGAAEPPRARAGPSSLTTPLQRLLKQPGELPSQAPPPLANTQTLTIMHLVTATPRPRTKGVPAMRWWRLARTDGVVLQQHAERDPHLHQPRRLARRHAHARGLAVQLRLQLWRGLASQVR